MEIIKKDNNTIFIDHYNNLMIICEPQNIDFFDETTKMELVNKNDRYYKFKSIMNIPTDITIIKPFYQYDLYKYRKKNKFEYFETYDDYKKNILPKINKIDKTWIINILDKKTENDKIIYENDDFILIPDITMQSNDINNDINKIHYLAISKNKTIMSIRDLNETHISILENIDLLGKKIISNKYNLAPNEIRSYLHYYPSVWLLHIHFDICNSYNHFSKLDSCHLIHNIIENIKICNNYYQQITLRVMKK
jgi:m7GpppX diphosphatase